MYNEVSVSSDGRGEVSVAWDVEGIVGKVLLSVHCPSAEILSQLQRGAYSTTTRLIK